VWLVCQLCGSCVGYVARVSAVWYRVVLCVAVYGDIALRMPP